MAKPTLSLIKVVDIRDGVFVMEEGGLRAVIEVPGVNFSLASSKEQEILISIFKQFLDGLDFKVQILLLSRYANIDKYIDILQERLKKETEPLIKFQLEEYINFLKEYISTHHVMQKIFYVVVPYDTPEAEVGFKLPLGKKAEVKEEDFNKKLEQLKIRVNYVLETLGGLGVQPRVLDDRDLLVLLFEMVNPSVYWQTVPKEVFDALTSIR
jgi:hypothetical protein